MTTSTSRLCMIWGSHSGGYEEYNLLGYKAVYSGECQPTCLQAGFLLSLFFRPWRYRRYVPPKRRLTLNGLHGVIIPDDGTLHFPTLVPNSLHQKCCHCTWFCNNEIDFTYSQSVFLRSTLTTIEIYSNRIRHIKSRNSTYTYMQLNKNSLTKFGLHFHDIQMILEICYYMRWI
jgi:hypothetical protein